MNFADFGMVMFSRVGYTDHSGGCNGHQSWWRWRGRYAVMTPGRLLTYAVVDDFGNLVQVPWRAK